MMEPSLPQRQRSSALCPEWPEAAKKAVGFFAGNPPPPICVNWGGVGNAVLWQARSGFTAAVPSTTLWTVGTWQREGRDICFHNVPNLNKTAERQRSRTTNKGLRDSGHTQAYDLYRRTSRSSTTFCRLLGQAFSRGTAWTAAPDKQMRLARTHRPRRRLGRRTPGLAVAFMCARQASGAAKCKPHALHSAKQESTDFRRARKLGECHELVHQLL